MTAAPLSTLVPEMFFRDCQHVYAALDGTATLKKYYDRVLGKKGVPSAAS